MQMTFRMDWMLSGERITRLHLRSLSHWRNRGMQKPNACGDNGPDDSIMDASLVVHNVSHSTKITKIGTSYFIRVFFQEILKNLKDARKNSTWTISQPLKLGVGDCKKPKKINFLKYS